MYYFKILLITLIAALPLIINTGCQSPKPAETVTPQDQALYKQPNYLFIKEIIAPAEVKLNSQVQVSCVANNPHGNDLSYSWSATGGIIKGEGSSVLWIAPESSGTYTIEVVASNGDLKSPSKSQSILVLD
jgi:hypothetical protein